MEGAQQVALIPVDIGWTDVGSWDSLLSLLPVDQEGNILIRPHVGIVRRRTYAALWHGDQSKTREIG